MPDVINADNAWLEPVLGCVGHVSEVNGSEAQEVPGIVLTRHELCVVVKYWTTQVIDYEFVDLFCYEQICSGGSRRQEFGERRIARIQDLIGEDAVRRAIDEATAEYGRNLGETWRAYRKGTRAERLAFRAKIAAEEEADQGE